MASLNVCGPDRHMYHADLLDLLCETQLAKQEAKLVTSSPVFLIIPLSNMHGPEPLALNKLNFETKIRLR